MATTGGAGGTTASGAGRGRRVDFDADAGAGAGGELILAATGSGLGGAMIGTGAGQSGREFAKLGLQIVGWVAMWRPLEIFLYDWWPVRNDRLLMDRLARMKVQLELPAA